MPSTNRSRQRSVADQAAEEEEWDPADWEWQPLSMRARKKARSGASDGFEAANLALDPPPCATPGSDVEPPVSVALKLEQTAGQAEPKFANLPVYNTLKKIESKPDVCVVDGCDANLAGLKRYFTRLRICEAHLSAKAIVVDGVISRFCQQCGRFQPLKDFTGKKKSCTERLEKVNARHREKAMQKNQPRRPDPQPQWQEVPMAWGGLDAAPAAAPSPTVRQVPAPAEASIGHKASAVPVAKLAAAAGTAAAASPPCAASDVMPLDIDRTVSYGGISSVPTLPAAASDPRLAVAAAVASGTEASSCLPLGPPSGGAGSGGAVASGTVWPGLLDDNGQATPGGVDGEGHDTEQIVLPSRVAAATDTVTAALGGRVSLPAHQGSVGASAKSRPVASREMFWNRVTSEMPLPTAQGNCSTDGGGAAPSPAEQAAATAPPPPPPPPPPRDVSRTLSAAHGVLFHPVRVQMMHVCKDQLCSDKPPLPLLLPPPSQQQQVEQQQQEGQMAPQPRTSTHSGPAAAISGGEAPCAPRVVDSPPMAPSGPMPYESPPCDAAAPMADTVSRGTATSGCDDRWVSGDAAVRYGAALTRTAPNNGTALYGTLAPPPRAAAAAVLGSARSDQSAIMGPAAAAAAAAAAGSSPMSACTEGASGAYGDSAGGVDRSHSAVQQASSRQLGAGGAAAESLGRCISGVMEGLAPLMAKVQRLAAAAAASPPVPGDGSGELAGRGSSSSGGGDGTGAGGGILASGSLSPGMATRIDVRNNSLPAVIESSREILERATELTQWLNQQPPQPPPSQPSLPLLPPQHQQAVGMPTVPTASTAQTSACTWSPPEGCASSGAPGALPFPGPMQGMQEYGNAMYGSHYVRRPYPSHAQPPTGSGMYLPRPSYPQPYPYAPQQNLQPPPQPISQQPQLPPPPPQLVGGLNSYPQQQMLQPSYSQPQPERLHQPHYVNPALQLQPQIPPPPPQLLPQPPQLPYSSSGQPVVLAAPIDHQAAKGHYYTRAMSAKSVYILNPSYGTGTQYGRNRPYPCAPLPQGYGFYDQDAISPYSYSSQPYSQYGSATQSQLGAGGGGGGGGAVAIIGNGYAVDTNGGEAVAAAPPAAAVDGSSAWRGDVPPPAAAMVSAVAYDEEDDDDDDDRAFNLLLQEMWTWQMVANRAGRGGAGDASPR
ncbi:hypothetical protein VOLCADRAFT_97206 [Volvox carteri f. nagariensis]|uniref:SBP-type domain-containing protein n=1 Tax=Volvox carteri f. nagariensis TaxID=3068 RepID=D8UC53_VOLCA|nr:uncharacterized protein VOLCADRAFT_97206 [Volvox carteri f. nagariensis]EFJ42739.1 hypothetical protein VOLCADRAFT_97206 [Volvox carteri f. nagariensis]|eukprot:XP_002956200.1 hypothetical protein VOLCADRAFT_97206 [Volvox carteri f. nagariensis]